MKLERQISDRDLDEIDRALGRPADPIGATPRNYLAVDEADAKRMRKSPFWHQSAGSSENPIFAVTPAGRQALAAVLNPTKHKDSQA